MYHDIRDPETHKLLFRYDPDHDRIEIGARRVIRVVDLNAIRRAHYADSTCNPFLPPTDDPANSTEG